MDGCSLFRPLLSGFCSDNHLSQAMLLWQCFHIPHEIYYGNWFLLERERQRQRQGEREKTNILFFSQELVIFLPHSKFLDIFIIYKGIPFIFLFAYLATKKTKFLQNATSCSRWWWFNFGSSHTWNNFFSGDFSLFLRE